MGEIDQKNETVVDEKLWGDDEEEERDEQEKIEVPCPPFYSISLNTVGCTWRRRAGR